MNPPGRRFRNQPVRFLTEDIWQKWLGFNLASLALIFLCILAVAITFGVFQSRDDKRYQRTRTDIVQLREPVGFYARKRNNQMLPANVFTTIIQWTTAGGAPAYDASDGAMNFLTGVWTTQHPGKYQVSASVCWTTSGALNTRQMIFLTNGSATMVPFTSTLGFGAVCTSMSVPMDLTAGMTLRVQALHTTAGAELVSTLITTFGMERIADL